MIETKDKRGGVQFSPGGYDRSSGRGRGNGGGKNDRANRSRRTGGASSGWAGGDIAGTLRSEKTERIIALVRATVPEESWRECHLHARNLLGEDGYKQLLEDIEAEKRGEKPRSTADSDPEKKVVQE